MPGLLERGSGVEISVDTDERLGRVELRRQIVRLERRLASLLAEGFPRVAVDLSVPAVAAQPRALGLGELEVVRDSLATRVRAVELALDDRAQLDRDNRALLERMLLDPAAYKWVRISRDDLGEPGCGHWHSRPRFGPLGMLMGWWRVKISSGCPLPGRLAAVER